MKKLFFVLVVLVFGSVFAKETSKTTQRVVTPTTKKLTDQQIAQLKEKALNTLNSKIWVISLIKEGEKKPTTERDVLKFDNNVLTSENLVSKGFGGSKISLVVGPDLGIGWETVQKSKDGSLAMWKGELKGETIFGSLNIISQKYGNESFSFNTASTLPVVKPSIGETTTTKETETKQETTKDISE